MRRGRGCNAIDQDGTPLATAGYRCSDLGRPAVDRPDAPGPYPQGTPTTDPRTGERVTTPPAPMVVTIPGATAAPATPAAPSPPAPRPGG